MLGKKSKIFVLVGMIALLVLTGVLNIYLNKSAEKANAGTDESSSAEAIEKAENDKLALTAAMDTELVLEGLIKAVGFDDAVVTSTTENINIIIKSPSLTSEQVAKVLEIVTSETGKSAASVRIIPVE